MHTINMPRIIPFGCYGAQYRRQMPRPARSCRTADRRSVCGKPFENSNLISRQRVRKSSVSGSNFQMQCR